MKEVLWVATITILTWTIWFYIIWPTIVVLLLAIIVSFMLLDFMLWVLRSLIVWDFNSKTYIVGLLTKCVMLIVALLVAWMSWHVADLTKHNGGSWIAYVPLFILVFIAVGELKSVLENLKEIFELRGFDNQAKIVNTFLWIISFVYEWWLDMIEATVKKYFTKLYDQWKDGSTTSNKRNLNNNKSKNESKAK